MFLIYLAVQDVSKVILIERFYTIPGDTKDNKRSGHVGYRNKRKNQNSFVESTPTWLLP